MTRDHLHFHKKTHIILLKEDTKVIRKTQRNKNHRTKQQPPPPQPQPHPNQKKRDNEEKIESSTARRRRKRSISKILMLDELKQPIFKNNFQQIIEPKNLPSLLLSIRIVFYTNINVITNKITTLLCCKNAPSKGNFS